MGGFFFILSFFVGYILSFVLFRLRTFWLNARVGAHNERRCSRSRGEDLTITDVIIKTPDMKWDWGCEWRHARKRWVGILRYFEKKHLVEIWDWTKRVGIRIWARPVQLFAAGCTRVCWVSGLRADAGRTVSIVKIVCVSLSLSLSSCRKPKSQEGNNSFVPEPRESSVFRRIPMQVNV